MLSKFYSGDLIVKGYADVATDSSSSQTFHQYYVPLACWNDICYPSEEWGYPLDVSLLPIADYTNNASLDGSFLWRLGNSIDWWACLVLPYIWMLADSIY